MNQYDPMKGNASSEDQGHRNDRNESADTYSTSDSGYTYHAGKTDNGQGYTNPDGSHGFIYNSSPSSNDRNRSYRGAVIALSAVLATAVIGTCCFFGAYMAAKSLNDTNPDGNTPPAETNSGSPEAGTSDGLIIRDDGTGEAETDHLTLPEKSPGESNTPNSPSSGDTIHTGNQNIPPVASIVKLPADRKDSDGDGKAEIETDENGEVLTSAGQDTVSVATVVNRVAASVVEITTETIVQSGLIGQYISSGAGSGVIISEEGFIVTNHHVIDGANTITVRMSDGKEFSATLIGTDEQTDIAVLWIDAGNYPLTVATLGASFDLVVGEDILAIGNPLGSLGGTVTEGMISATAREISVSGANMTLLQVSAPINPGNSGGGLFNMAGDLVGIVNAKVSSEEIEGLGFAIPIDTAYEVILELIDHGYVRGRPAIDFTVVDVTSIQTAMRYFDSFNLGVYVYDDDHEALQYGDLILTADGVEITSVSSLYSLIQSKSVGETMELLVYRNREQVTVIVSIVEQLPEALKPAA